MSIETKHDKYQKLPAASFKVGFQLPFDIYEETDVLLLRKGSVITPNNLRNLQYRKLAHVYLRSDDLKKATPTAFEGRMVEKLDLETAHTQELDSMQIEDVSADGAALIESFGKRKKGAFDAELVEHMVKSHEQDMTALSEQFHEILEGFGEISGEGIVKIANKQIWSMAEDLDAAMSVCQMSRKNDYRSNHSVQMSIMGMALAAEMQLAEEDVRVTGMSALLHDLGMGKVPDWLIESPQRLDRVTFLEIMKHPIHTLDLTEKVLGIPNRTRLIVYQVHERNNGTGYPRNRAGNLTYNLSKVIGIVDVYLSLISDRPFRKALLPYDAMLKILEEAKLGFWDPQIMRSFLSLIGLFPVGSFVMLSNECMAKVVRSGGEHFAMPQVMITHNANGVPQKSNTIIDLAEEQEDENGIRILRTIPPLFSIDDET